jgi:UDP-2,3-diacylglucosamine pyrophosphatase LpxH
MSRAIALPLLLLPLLLLFAVPAQAAPPGCPPVFPGGAQRVVVAISDLHMGLGKVGNGWANKEDFRWPNALAGFLERVGACGKQRVDLVIAGDAFEFWQQPDGISCKGPTDDTSCSVDELVRVAGHVASQHGATLRELDRFARKGENAVYFVPGNHDAGLLVDEVWRALWGPAGPAPRVHRCGREASGRCTTQAAWLSADGDILIEHGHQIGADLNGFRHWPSILTGRPPALYLEQPWGQYFVQTLFNKQEENYSIIDNLLPESAGIKYRMRAQGFWDSVRDVATFLHFNLLTTSLLQKGAVLGQDDAQPVATEKAFDEERARALGADLYIRSLPKNDALRKTLASNDPQANALKAALAQRLRDRTATSTDEVYRLCESMAVATDGAQECPAAGGAQLGALVQAATSAWIEPVAKYLRDRTSKTPLKNVTVYIYGHTHQWENEGQAFVEANRFIRTYNTGAFQRVIKEKQFLALAGASPEQALGCMRNEDLPPCYTAVVASKTSGAPRVETLAWRMDECTDGEFLAPERCEAAEASVKRCGAPPPRTTCPARSGAALR